MMMQPRTMLLGLMAALLMGCSNVDTQAGDNTGRPCLGAGSIACNSGTASSPAVSEPQASTIADPTFDPSFRCSATPDSSVVYPGDLVDVAVSITGRPGPFIVDNFGGLLFGTDFTLRGSYNDPGVDKAMTRVFYVYDANSPSIKTKCSFPITVKTNNASGSSALACTLNATPNVASPNVPVELAVKLTGATGNVGLEIWPAPHWKLAWSDLRIVSATEARANVQFPTEGQRSPYAYVSDGTHSAICNTSISVFSPVLNVMASPATVAYPGQSILLSTGTAGFPATPTLTFTTAEPGVSIAVTGTTATVRNLDGLPHNFSVVVTATQGALQKVQTITLAYLASSSGALACQITAPVRPFVGDSATLQLAVAPGSSLNESLQKMDYQLPSDATVLSGGTLNSLLVKFSSTGLKTIRIKAQGTSSLTPCNSDGWVQTTVIVVDHLATRGCLVGLSVGSSKLNESVVAQATLAADVGRGPFELEALTVQNSTPSLWDLDVLTVAGSPHPNNNLLALTVQFFKSLGGNISQLTWVTYQARVVDQGDSSSQSEATCNSTHTLRPQ